MLSLLLQSLLIVFIPFVTNGITSTNHITQTKPPALGYTQSPDFTLATRVTDYEHGHNAVLHIDAVTVDWCYAAEITNCDDEQLDETKVYSNGLTIQHVGNVRVSYHEGIDKVKIERHFLGWASVAAYDSVAQDWLYVTFCEFQSDEGCNAPEPTRVYMTQQYIDIGDVIMTYSKVAIGEYDKAVSEDGDCLNDWIGHMPMSMKLAKMHQCDPNMDTDQYFPMP